jgi:ribosomal protein L40E
MSKKSVRFKILIDPNIEKMNQQLEKIQELRRNEGHLICMYCQTSLSYRCFSPTTIGKRLCMKCKAKNRPKRFCGIM